MSHAHDPKVCTIEDILPTEDFSYMTESQRKVVDEYFSQFAAPILEDHEGSRDLVCFNCGSPLFGVRSDVFGEGGYTQTRNIGQGKCRGCAWPARSHHVIFNGEPHPLLSIGSKVLMFLSNPEAPILLEDTTDELYVPEIVAGQESRA